MMAKKALQDLPVTSRSLGPLSLATPASSLFLLEHLPEPIPHRLMRYTLLAFLAYLCSP